MENLLETVVTDGVCTATLNDPARSNPLSAGMLHGLRAMIERVRSDPAIRSVLLTARGKSFCAGGDLVDMDTLSPALLKRFMADSQAIARDLALLPVPVVVAVNGAAAGAGFSLAMTGDLVLASEKATFVPAFARIGAVPDLGLAQLLRQTLGLHRASRILLLNETLTAAHAAELGLIAEVVPHEELMPRAAALARELAAGPTVALGLTKGLLRTSASGSLAEFLEAESSAQAIAFTTADFREGIAAIRGRRAPTFAGK